MQSRPIAKILSGNGDDSLAKYLMLDRRFLNPQAMENVALRITPPEKDQANNPLFIQDQPWEIRIDNGYPNVIYDEQAQIFRCYYTLFTDDLDTEGTTLAERTSRTIFREWTGLLLWLMQRAGTVSIGRSRL